MLVKKLLSQDYNVNQLTNCFKQVYVGTQIMLLNMSEVYMLYVLSQFTQNTDTCVVIVSSYIGAQMS